jgi:hypothetical protein
VRPLLHTHHDTGWLLAIQQPAGVGMQPLQLQKPVCAGAQFA